MKNFDKYISDILNESVVDIPRNSLDQTVFQFPPMSPPIMHPIIKTQIMNDIETIKSVVKVEKYFVVGSILTKNYTPRSDIDVNVQIDPPDEQFVSRVFDVVRRINGKLAAGSTHPINYFIHEEDYDLDKTDAAYDVANETWIKEPENVGVDVRDYMDRFQSSVESIDYSTSELRRDIIDLEELKSMDKDQINDLSSRVEEKIEEIESGIDSLLNSYKQIKRFRKGAFKRDMTPDEVRKYGQKNKLPENVIYKMIERYYYFDFMNKLKEIMEDGEVSSSELKTIKKAGKDLWK